MQNRHADLDNIITQKPVPPSNSERPKARPIQTSTRQSMSYVTVAGIQSDTSWREQDFVKESVKELVSNCHDFLRETYPNGTKETNKIQVQLKIDTIPTESEYYKRIVARIAVRNTNIDNVPVFEDLKPIFDYTLFVSTKRNQHKISSGALGDFLKRSLGMGYALWTNDYNREDSVTTNDIQWSEPVILRHNNTENKVFLHVNWDKQEYYPIFSEPTEYDAPDFTEVEVALPIDSTSNDYWRDNIDFIIKQVQEYIKRAKIAKSNVDLSLIVIRGI